MRILVFFALCLFLTAPLQAAEAAPRVLCEAASPDGRIRAEWLVTPAAPRLSDAITLELRVETDALLEPVFPEFGAAMGELEIVDMEVGLDEVSAEHDVVRSRRFTVVPRHGGPTPIWPTPIRYSDRRQGPNQSEDSIVLPAATLEILAEVTPETASLDNISGRPELIEIPSPGVWPWIVCAAVLAALFFLLLGIRRRNRRGSDEGASNLSPQEIALSRLALLVESRLYEDDVKRFFIELTGIVRWYIEQQTNIRAPELTTEEFLNEISLLWRREGLLTPELRDRLRLFLESSDRVKFAKFRPSREEIMQGVRRAEEFVRQFAREKELRASDLSAADGPAVTP